MATLSVCMIVKNEERFIKGCLDSIQAVADQIVVVDTGSSDRTADIARSFGAEIYHHAWSDDFAAARNASIQYASGDWILWLDADERLMSASVTPLKRALRQESKAVAYIVNINNHMRSGNYRKISSAHRLFTNVKGIRFDGRIHEQIADSISRLHGEERPSDIWLEHLGYGLEEEAQKRKNSRNERLLLRMVSENPDYGYGHFTLAQHYSLTQRPQKALQHYQAAYERKGQFSKAMQASLLNTMAEAHLMLGQYEQADDFACESLQLFSEQMGANYVLYKTAEKRGRTDDAIASLERLQRENQRLKQRSNPPFKDVMIDSDYIRFHLAGLYYTRGDVRKAVRQYESISEDAYYSKALERLVPLYLQSGRFIDAEQALRYLCQQDGCPQAHRELLGNVWIKLQKFDRAIEAFEALLRENPQNETARKRLAGLYAKRGDRARAEALLTEMAYWDME